MKVGIAALASVLVLAAATALTIGWSPMAPRPAPTGALEGAAVGGPFRLIDQDGRVVTSDSFRGRYRLMYFGFTYCPDICPTDVQKMSQALRLFEQRDPARAARIQPIMVTIDPERDTPKILKQFVSNFHPRLIGLTGPPAAITDTLRRFGVYASRQQVGGASSYLMDHSALMYLMGPKGDPITFFARDATPDQIASELDTYVR
ncbi:SCO family protein [Sphingobium sp. 10 DY56-G10]|uniref:SCO family protein n=1 Tax=Sphingomonadales TaxID=204457 RepID=UPI0000D7BF23|nr:SCO family protein [Sphingomonas sp. SKA58]EAT09466.1 Electron transport protein [Sphingomonas sp. SKA58]MAM83578.1 SCO family protein [Acidobacteriota bacterium]